MMNVLRTLDFDLLSPEERALLTERTAARAVVFDENRLVGLIYVEKHGFYKIPGGGVEAGEDLITALKRECREEIGCMVEVDQEIGITVEYRAKHQIRQESYCYLGHIVGSKDTPNLSDQEAADGFRVLWVPLHEAIRLVEGANTETYQGKCITPRELVFLKEAARLLEQKVTLS